MGTFSAFCMLAMAEGFKRQWESAWIQKDFASQDTKRCSGQIKTESTAELNIAHDAYLLRNSFSALFGLMAYVPSIQYTHSTIHVRTFSLGPRAV